MELFMNIEKHNYLMIPGPSEIATESQIVMAQPTIVHYGDAWVRMNERVISKLKRVFRTENEIYIVPGSSSAVMEASVNAIVEPGTEVLVELSGFFGHRFREIVEGCGGTPVTVDFEFGKAVDPDVIRNMLKEHPNVKAMTLVHNESSTGVTNPAREITRVCHDAGVILICDTVSSMGGIDIRTDEWDLDFCLTGNQKALQAPPGLGSVSVGMRAWGEIEKRKSPVHGWFLNLVNIRRYCNDWRDWHPQGPVTAPTAIYAALEAALDLILEEGLETRFRRHAINAKAIRAGLRAAGIELFVSDEVASNTLTSFIVPDGLDEKKIMKILRDEFHTAIAGPPGPIGKNILRVGHMGVTSNRNAIIAVLSAIIFACNRLGAKLSAGSANEAVLDVYASNSA